jgi:hypothetical protein
MSMLRFFVVGSSLLLLVGCSGSTGAPTSEKPTMNSPPSGSPLKPGAVTKAEAEPVAVALIKELTRASDEDKFIFSEPMVPEAQWSERLYAEYKGLTAFYVTRIQPTSSQKVYIVFIGHKEGQLKAAGMADLESFLKGDRDKDWLAKNPPPKLPLDEKK